MHQELQPQLAHLYEALTIVREINDDTQLRDAVDTSGALIRKCRAKLVAFRAGAEYEKITGRIRNHLTLHYDPKTIFSALETLAAKTPDARGSLTLSDDPITWICEPGDMIGDRATMREIFKIQEAADVREEVGKIVMRLHKIAQWSAVSPEELSGRTHAGGPSIMAICSLQTGWAAAGYLPNRRATGKTYRGKSHPKIICRLAPGRHRT